MFRRCGILVGAVAAVMAIAAPVLGAPATPNFNLEAVLRPVGDGPDTGFGLVEFRQPKDDVKIVQLDVWVRDLAPIHGYSLQRATDVAVNDDCVGTNWLTLGDGPVPHMIATDERGTGRADLFRDLASVPLGMEFDIRFRVIDASTSEVVLQSTCYQFTVSQ
jgi:hypothetical protein